MSLTTLLLLGAFGLGSVLFIGLIVLVVMMTGKKAAPSAPSPQVVVTSGKPSPEDLLLDAFDGVDQFARRRAAVQIGDRLATHKAKAMAQAIAEGVQEPIAPKG